MKRWMANAALLLVILLSLTGSVLAAVGYNTNDGTDPDRPLTDTTAFVLRSQWLTEGDTQHSDSPPESLTVQFTPHALSVSADASLTRETMPCIGLPTEEGSNTGRVQIPITQGTAGESRTVSVEVPLPEYPRVGHYWYAVQSVPGQTAGVGYDPAVYYLHVQVINDPAENGELLRLVTLHTEPPEAQTAGDVKNGDLIHSYASGALSVTNQVSGNMADMRADYEMEIRLAYPAALLPDGSLDEDFCPVQSVISCVKGEEETLLEWRYQNERWVTNLFVPLRHGETVTLYNIPYGVYYTVTEQNYAAAGYDHGFQIDSLAAEQQDRASFQDGAWDTARASGRIEDALDAVIVSNYNAMSLDVGIDLGYGPFVLMAVLSSGALGLFLLRRRKEAV